MSRRPVSADVSPEEMRKLREPPYNLSNREIAERVGCSYVTVLKYIGRERQRKKPAADKPTTSQKVWESASSVTRLYARGREYLCNFTKQTATASFAPGLELTPDTVHSIINELTYIEQVFAKAKQEGRAQ